LEYKSIFISDVHLGTKDSQATSLLDFLKDNESENLYLVGDIIDGWALKRKWKWIQSHSDVVQKVLRKARKGTNVYYVLGNHDEFVRGFLPLQLGDNLTIVNEMEHIGVNGRRYLVTHGDLFDSITMTKKWLAIVGDQAYMFFLRMNRPLNFLRKLFGYNRYWSLSKYLKQNVKKSVMFIDDYENILSLHAKQHEYDGVICGHIHHPEIKEMGGIEYLNTGDWVESRSAIVEHYDGRFELIEYED
jgi:UDP-2,3-diacylglucosamine pyrophosphatase LpxH